MTKQEKILRPVASEDEGAYGALERFERAADAFYKATGMLMPGKDICAAAGWTEEKEEERKNMFKVWCAAIEYMREHPSTPKPVDKIQRKDPFLNGATKFIGGEDVI